MEPEVAVGVQSSEYDALADLFLAEDSAAPTPAFKKADVSKPAAPRPASPEPCPARRQIQVEGVIAGHLPVLASAWVTQYARHAADAAHEPVAMLRLAGGQVWLDVVMPGGSRVPIDAAAKPGESLEAILQQAATRWHKWLVRVDEPSEPDLLKVPGLAAIAILTGADDVAVMASYQVIKSLGQEEPSAESDAGPALKLVIMGSQNDKASEAENKLQRAASRFLGRSIDPALRVGKIGASLGVQVHRGPASIALEAMLAIIQATAPAPRASTSPSPLAIAPIAHLPSSPTTPPLADPPSRSAKLELVETAPFDISLPNLQRLEATCPYAPGVQLAAASDGRLHLIANDPTANLGECTKRLLTAAAWAHDHAQLLAIACPQLKSSSPEPVLHVVTDNARDTRALLDTGVRIHLAVRVDVGGARTWAYTDLN
jgi:hypothetical protein